MTDALLTAIDKLPGADGWWHGSNGETYRGLVEELREFGVPDDRIEGILSSAYGAAADEFGS